MSSHLFSVLAGTSKDTFQIGGVTFQAAPFTLSEYEEYSAATDGLPFGEALQRKAELLAEKLQPRIKGVTPTPSTITAQWLKDNLELPKITVLEHIFLYGKMPEAGGSGNP